MVFVIDKHKRPCNTISAAYARILLFSKQAVIYKRFPFTIRLRNDKAVLKDKSYTVKLDPGSRTTGVAITDDKESVVMLAEIEHRGHIIKKSLDKRRVIRRSRRNRKTRYREARFLNRTRPQGWLAPSVKSRADNVINFIKKHKKLLNINRVMIEDVSFDIAQMSSDIKLWGNDYQQGSLYNKNLREFIFSKTKGRCSYCGAKAGTDSTYNLAASCRSCNEKKSNLSLKEFGKLMNKDYSQLEPKKLPKDAAIVQSARNYMVKEITKIIPDTTNIRCLDD